MPGTLVVAKSPMVTGTAAPPGLARSRSTMARDRSTPCTRTPRPARGSAIRPVPTPSSSARPPSPASPARNSTVGPTTRGANISADEASYPAATASPKYPSSSTYPFSSAIRRKYGTGRPSAPGFPGGGLAE